MASEMDDDMAKRHMMPDIACCICGMLIQPNQVNMCLKCLKDRVDITEGFSKEEHLVECTICGRFRGNGEERWLVCEPESPELLALCLKHVHGLGKGKKDSARFIDAKWIWTEPHSKRLKVKVTVEKDILNGATVRQKFDVTFVIQNRQCRFCAKEVADQNWTTIIQVRQAVAHKKTLLTLENTLLRDGAAKNALRINAAPSGIDFYFGNKTHATKFADHIMGIVPSRKRESKALIGADMKSNKHHFRYTICIEVVPICRHDLLILPKQLQNSLFGGKQQPVLCDGVTKTLGLVDPATGKQVRMTENKYWAHAFQPIATSRDLVEFTVLDVQPVDYSNEDSEIEVTVARESDFEEFPSILSHVGKLLSPGDQVLGYDFSNSTMDDEILKLIPNPVVLVQKCRPKRDKNTKKKKKKQRRGRGGGAGDDETSSKKPDDASTVLGDEQLLLDGGDEDDDEDPQLELEDVTEDEENQESEEEEQEEQDHQQQIELNDDVIEELSSIS